MLKSNTAFLDNVCAMRLMLIVLLIVYHAFAPFCGDWPAPQDFKDITSYWWIAKSAYSFMLESFVFISGFLFGYQVVRKGPQMLEFKNFAIKKAKRLWLPCILFGSIYFLLICDLHQPIWSIVYQIVNGIGHHWFLPMLFWCFIAVYLIEKLSISAKVALPILTISSVFSFLPLPLQMGKTMYYALFFYIGYLLAHRPNVIDKYLSPRNIALSWTVFISAFMSLTFVKNGGGYSDLLTKVFYLAELRLCTLIYSMIGVTASWLTVNWLLQKGYVKLSQRAVRLSSMCFGVYIYQQFVLRLMYYNFDMIHTVPTVWLPWIGIGVAFIVSILLTRLTLATRIGRYLIG